MKAMKKTKQKEKSLLGIVSFVAIVAILLMLYQSGLDFGNLAGYATKIAKAGSTKTVATKGKIAISCSDSDSGADLTVKGVTKGPLVAESSSASEEYDSCKDSETVVEWVCENGLLTAHEYSDYAEDRDYRTICTCEDGVCTNLVSVSYPAEERTVSSTAVQRMFRTKVSKPATECYETDSGIDYTVQGEMGGGTWYTTEEAYDLKTDVCEESGKLKEYYCSDATHGAYTRISCEEKVGSSSVCEEGACTRS